MELRPVQGKENLKHIGPFIMVFSAWKNAHITGPHGGQCFFCGSKRSMFTSLGALTGFGGLYPNYQLIPEPSASIDEFASKNAA